MSETLSELELRERAVTAMQEWLVALAQEKGWDESTPPYMIAAEVSMLMQGVLS